MNTDKKLLQYIHKNAAMGVSTIPQVLSMPQSRAMSQALNDQLREYRSIAARSQGYARRRGRHLKGPGTAALVMSGAMLQAQTAADRSTSHLAELMIRGRTDDVLCVPVEPPRLRELGMGTSRKMKLTDGMQSLKDCMLQFIHDRS